MKKTVCPGGDFPCAQCYELYVQPFTDESDNQKLLVLKNYVPNALVTPSEFGYKVFSFIESTFVLNVLEFKDNKESYMENFVDKLFNTMCNMFPDITRCCLEKLLRRFFKIRMIFYAKWLTNEAKDSPTFVAMKTAAGHASASHYGYMKTRN